MKPRVVVTQWLRDLPTPLGERTRLYTLDPAYAEHVARAGATPLIAPHAADPADVLEGAHGLLVSGGGDVDPASYHAVDGGGTEDVDPAVDLWELQLLAEARRREIPTFGICRGMQLLAVACGGTLDQHILDSDAHPGMGVLPPDDTLALRHDVTVEPGTRLAEALGRPTLPVNTIHHQAVSDPGELRIAARGPGGVIEALEAPEWRAFGVQWHPEKMDEPLQQRLFELLVGDAAAAANAR